ncbi:chloramphenicol acetyltransferase [Bacillaceae bacterium SAOS 7]|nr:chloramphenicol acetyltransferase [Bacillaceae bacterium SAOS 7]
MEKLLSVEPYIHEHVVLKNSQLGEYTEVGAYNHLENVVLDDYSFTGAYCMLQNTEIGKFANIAPSVRIGATTHPMDRPTLHHITYRRKMYGVDTKDDVEFFSWRESQVVRLGHDTWIGHGAIIMPGVTIGNGAIIGAGAVVTKDVAPYSVVVGVPVKEVRKRFNEEIIESLERIQWWDWSHELIKERIELLSGSVEEFINMYDQGRSDR